MSSIARTWQNSVNKAGEDWAVISRFLCYLVSGWYALNAVLAPVSEYCFVGKHNFYKLWQKCCFSAGFASLSFGFFKLGRTFRTSNQRSRGY